MDWPADVYTERKNGASEFAAFLQGEPYIVTPEQRQQIMDRLQLFYDKLDKDKRQIEDILDG